MNARAHTAPMTRLQGLLHRWIDADPARNPRDLARAAKLSPSVIYALLGKPLKDKPADETFAALARAGVAAESVLRFNVAIDLGLLPEGVDLDDPEILSLVR